MRYMTRVLLVMLTSLCTAQAPPTIEQFLRTKHILNNPSALQTALSSSDSSVRGAAAVQLAVLKSYAALPDLRIALEREHDSRAKLNIARALTMLGDSGGESTRRSVCSDNNTPDDLRVQAAAELAPDLGVPCMLALSHVIAASANDAVIYAALRTLIQEQPEKAVDLGSNTELIHAFTSGLKSDVMVVRGEAARAIALYKAYATGPELKIAMNKENDPDAREAMRLALTAVSP